MKNAEFHSAYIGMYDITPDEHPVIDYLSESLGIEGLYCCVGLSGHGFKLCPAFGIINIEMILKSENQIFNRTHFALDRFDRQAAEHQLCRPGERRVNSVVDPLKWKGWPGPKVRLIAAGNKAIN